HRQVNQVTLAANGKVVAVASCRGYNADSQVRQALVYGHHRNAEIQLWHVDEKGLDQALDTQESEINQVAVSPDGRVVAAGSVMGRIRMWESATGQELHTINAHTGAVFSIGFSPDGAQLASASRDGEIAVWDVATGEQLGTLAGHRGA